MSASNVVSAVQIPGSGLQQRATVKLNQQEEGEVSVSSDTQKAVSAQAAQIVKKGLSQNSGLDRQKMDEAVSKVNDFLQLERRDLTFSLDDDSGQMVVKITDAKTQQVIRQMPSETMLHIAKELDRLKGLLFEERA